MDAIFKQGNIMDAISKSLLITLSSGKQAFKRGTIVFTNGGGISDLIIRIAQGFKGYTHCGIALGDGKMIAAWGAENKVIEQDDLQQVVTEARMPSNKIVPDIEAAIAMTTANLGHSYDFGSLLGFVGLPTWGQGPPVSFVCSSLLAYCVFEKVNFKKTYRQVLPQDIWDLLQ